MNLAKLILGLLLFCSAASAEEFLPAGSRVTSPDGGLIVVLKEPLTCISPGEKEIFVRNDDLWQVDKETIVELKGKIVDLERKGTLDDQEMELVKQRAELEKQRAEFYKEQMAFKDQVHKDTVDALKEQVKVSQPSTLDKVAEKGGWIGLLVTIGIIIGLAL